MSSSLASAAFLGARADAPSGAWFRSVLCWAMLLMLGCSGRPGERYLLPDGYTGWISVTFKAREAPTLSREEGFQLVTVPESGKVETREKMRTGEGYIRRYYWVRAGGSRKEAPIGGGHTICGRELVWCVFIGDESEWQRYKRLYGDDADAVLEKGVCARHIGRMPAD